MLLCLVLVLDALAASPVLHQLVHHDADTPGHECVVTLFLHGQIDSSVVAVVAIIPPGRINFLSPALAPVFNAQVETLPPGRAPPLGVLPS